MMSEAHDEFIQCMKQKINARFNLIIIVPFSPKYQDDLQGARCEQDRLLDELRQEVYATRDQEAIALFEQTKIDVFKMLANLEKERIAHDNKQNGIMEKWKKEIDDTLREFALMPLWSLDNTIPEALLPDVQSKILIDLHEKVQATGNPKIIAYLEEQVDKLNQAVEKIKADEKRNHEQYWKEMLEKYPRAAEYNDEEKERVFTIRDDVEGTFKRAKFLVGRYFDEPPMKLTIGEVINLILTRIGALELKVQMVNDPWLTDQFKEKNTEFNNSEKTQKLYQKHIAEKRKPVLKRLLGL
jgi:hypothetical protein